jgi:Na+(H+)/acetate symporter ActP
MLAGSLSGLVVALSPLVHSRLAQLILAAYAALGLAAVLSVLWGRMLAAPTRVTRT